VDSGPAREPGGALSRRQNQPSIRDSGPASWLVSSRGVWSCPADSDFLHTKTIPHKIKTIPNECTFPLGTSITPQSVAHSNIANSPLAKLPSIAWCCAIGSALLPVVTLPTGLNRAGLPVGVQVIGPFLSDLRLLRIAEILNVTAGFGFIPPLLG
jgi:Asp-tRNA(Asn)/Glu-tRNA(Gln) amidotransferase A subunit family amidase